VQVAELCPENEPALHVMGATPAPAHAEPDGQGTVLFVEAAAQKIPTEHGVQAALLATEKVPAAHKRKIAPLGQAEPGGHGIELLDAAAGHRIPPEQGRQLVAAMPPAEKVPAVQTLGAMPLPWQAEPGGQSIVLTAVAVGQKMPGAHASGLAPLPAQYEPALHGSAGSAALPAQ